jgi:predicted phage terminase large subunit-like protein
MKWPDQFELRYIAVDPSKGKDAKKGDYSAIVFVGVVDGKLWVDSDLARRPVDRLVRDTIEMQRRYGAFGVGVEANTFQELIGPEISRVAAEQGNMIPMPLYMINNTINKELRIGRLGPYLSRKELMFKSTPSNRLLVAQLKEFPNGDHDDGPDALEMAIRLGLELSGQSTEGNG